MGITGGRAGDLSFLADNPAVNLYRMKLYDAIDEMRRLSREGKPFSFSFMSYNSSQGTSDGVVHVRKARTMKREALEFNRNAEMQERYLDLDTMQPRRFWHPLLMTFNGEKVTV